MRSRQTERTCQPHEPVHEHLTHLTYLPLCLGCSFHEQQASWSERNPNVFHVRVVTLLFLRGNENQFSFCFFWAVWLKAEQPVLGSPCHPLCSRRQLFPIPTPAWMAGHAASTPRSGLVFYKCSELHYHFICIKKEAQ